MTVQELLSKISSSEITEWKAYLNLKINPDKHTNKARYFLLGTLSNRIVKKVK